MLNPTTTTASYHSLTPFEDIKKAIELPQAKLKYLPQKWELIGDVLVLKLHDELQGYEELIGERYSEVLRAKTVLRDDGHIKGRFREPSMHLIYGKDTETVHIENKVRFKLDVARLMFSSGNIDERVRMARVATGDDVIVDMFAGIGYFTIPLAVHAHPKRVIAYELNPLAYRYLKANIELNRVEHVVEPHLSDNTTAVEHVADRVLMGYLHKTYEYLPKALRILKGKGVLHYHENCPNALLPDLPLERIKAIAEKLGYSITLMNYKVIKSFAPGVSHVVLDVRVVEGMGAG